MEQIRFWLRVFISGVRTRKNIPRTIVIGILVNIAIDFLWPWMNYWTDIIVGTLTILAIRSALGDDDDDDDDFGGGGDREEYFIEPNVSEVPPGLVALTR